MAANIIGSIEEAPFDIGTGEGDFKAKTYKPEAMEPDLLVASVSEKLLPNIIVDNQRPKQRSRHKSFLFSSKELCLSITASETTRTICSVSTAFVVVLSFIDYPLLGINIVNSKSIVAMRPLYMLLVTEFTILIVYLVLERRRRGGDSVDDPRVLNEGGLDWERAVRVLERGLAAHQMIRAIFIDFSVYVVIIVCVLSLV